MLKSLIIKFLAKNTNTDNDDQKQEDMKSDMEEGTEKETKKIEDNTYSCLTKLLKIIDVGLDKNYESFAEDIKNIAQPLLQFNESYSNNSIKLKNLPITEYRCYKHPKLSAKKIGPLDSEFDYIHYNDKTKFNLFEFYFKEFHEFYQSNFKYLHNDGADCDDQKKAYNKRLRFNIYKDFKPKIILSEEKKMLNVFIDQLYSAHKIIDSFNSNSVTNHDNLFLDIDFKAFWKNFVDNFEEIDINYLLYVVPWMDDVKHHYPNYTSPDDVISLIIQVPNLLSEFLAGKDYIFLNLIYNPWVTFRLMENDIETWIESWIGTEKTKTFARSQYNII